MSVQPTSAKRTALQLAGSAANAEVAAARLTPSAAAADVIFDQIIMLPCLPFFRTLRSGMRPAEANSSAFAVAPAAHHSRLALGSNSNGMLKFCHGLFLIVQSTNLPFNWSNCTAIC